MKISKSQLKKLIKESIMKEMSDGSDPELRALKEKYVKLFLEAGHFTEFEHHAKMEILAHRAIMEIWTAGYDAGWDEGVAEEMLGTNRP